MGFRQPELGVKTNVRRRVGFDFESFRGVNKEAPPGSIGPDEFQEAINIRILPSGKIVGRGGQGKTHTDPLPGCVTMIFDDEIPVEASEAVYYSGHRLGDPVTGGYETIGKIRRLDPATDEVTLVGDVAALYSARFQDELFVAFTYDIFNIDLETGEATVEVTMPGAPVEGLNARGVKSMIAFDAGAGEKLWLVIAGEMMADTVGEIYSWDRVNDPVLEIEVTSINTGVLLMVYAEDLYYCSEDLLLKRNGGTWDPVSFGALAGEIFRPTTSWAVYNGILYFSGTRPAVNPGEPRPGTIYSYNGTTITMEREFWTTGMTYDPGWDGWCALTVMNDYLYYSWLDFSVRPAEPAPNEYIGRYNGTTWDDTHKNITAQWGSEYNGGVYWMMTAGDNLYLVGPEIDDEPETTGRVLRSPGADTAGEYVIVDRRNIAEDAHTFTGLMVF
jgi:hypothetical protein